MGEWLEEHGDTAALKARKERIEKHEEAQAEREKEWRRNRRR
jgi:hypothetical protein